MKKINVKFTLNGEPIELEVQPNHTALRVIREQLDLTGAKEGCGAGECGACTIIVDGLAVNSCLIAGNLCRCTGYKRIIEAVEDVVNKRGGK